MSCKKTNFDNVIREVSETAGNFWPTNAIFTATLYVNFYIGVSKPSQEWQSKSSLGLNNSLRILLA